MIIELKVLKFYEMFLITDVKFLKIGNYVLSKLGKKNTFSTCYLWQIYLWNLFDG